MSTIFNQTNIANEETPHIVSIPHLGWMSVMSSVLQSSLVPLMALGTKLRPREGLLQTALFLVLSKAHSTPDTWRGGVNMEHPFCMLKISLTNIYGSTLLGIHSFTKFRFVFFKKCRLPIAQ